jgi:hypothetical protein
MNSPAVKIQKEIVFFVRWGDFGAKSAPDVTLSAKKVFLFIIQ